MLLPVLTDKDIHDLRDFACKHCVDYVAASFVQVMGKDFWRSVRAPGF